MALKKTITLQNGIQAEYWRIKHLTLEHGVPCVEGVLEPYLNQSVREDGNQPIQGNRIPFRFTPEKVLEDVSEEFDTGEVDEDGNHIMETRTVQQETGEVVWNFSEEILAKKDNTLMRQAYKEIKRTNPEFADAVDC